MRALDRLGALPAFAKVFAGFIALVGEIAGTVTALLRRFLTFILGREKRYLTPFLTQDRFFGRALRTVKEYNETVEYIHLNPVRGGLAGC